MRQAGRYLPEYRALRQKHSLLELCHKPDLAAQVTLQPVERLRVDAAILFADILLPFEPLGLGLTFAAVEGPQITRPIREAAPVLDLPPVDPATDLGYVLEAVRLVGRALPAHGPLIGFAGAPFTLASYAIEGGGTRDFMLTKRFMYAEPRAWHELMRRLAERSEEHTSELQSRLHLVCRLLLEKKKDNLTPRRASMLTQFVVCQSN